MVHLIGGHNPPDITPPGSEPLCQWQGRTKPAEHNPLCQNPLYCTQCTMPFYVTGNGVLKAKFQDWRT